MLDNLLKYVDCIIPVALKQDSKILNKTRFLIGMLIFIFAFAIVIDFTGLYDTTDGFSYISIVVTYLYSIVCFTVLWVFKKLPIAVHCFVVLATVNLNITIMQTGGMFSSTLDWLSAIPVIVLLMVGFRSAAVWTIVLAINFIGVYCYSENVFPSTAVKEDYFINSFFLLFFLLILIILFWRSQKRLVKDLEKHQMALEGKQQALERKNEQLKNKTHELNTAQIALANSNNVLGIQNDHLCEIQEALLDSNNALERYAHTVSHDLKEPLRSIRSFTDLLHRHYERQGLIDERGKEYFDFVLKGTENMEDLIREMLKFSEASGDKSNFRVIDLNQTLQIVKQNLSNQIQETGVKINSERLPKVYGLAIPLTQLFQNIISNAIKFRQEGVIPHIDIAARENEQQWTFSISDNGIGIKEEECLSVFEEFNTTSEQRNIEGQGIGLATCQKIVKKHNGTIWVESSSNKGATFYFTIKKYMENNMNKLTGPESKTHQVLLESDINSM